MSSNTTNHKNGSALLPSLFSFKAMRIKIAKWALSAESVTIDDLKLVFDFDFDQATNEKIQSRVADALKVQLPKLTAEAIGKQVGDLAPDVIGAIIAQSTWLGELQKSQLIAILNAPTSKTDYIA